MHIDKHTYVYIYLEPAFCIAGVLNRTNSAAHVGMYIQIHIHTHAHIQIHVHVYLYIYI